MRKPGSWQVLLKVKFASREEQLDEKKIESSTSYVGKRMSRFTGKTFSADSTDFLSRLCFHI